MLGGLSDMPIRYKAVWLAAVVGYVVWFNPLGGIIAGEWSRETTRYEERKAEELAIQHKFREENYALMCPDYFEHSSFLARQWPVNSLAWCEDYRDRIGGDLPFPRVLSFLSL